MGEVLRAEARVPVDAAPGGGPQGDWSDTEISTPLNLPQKDELGHLAIEMNAMCAHLVEALGQGDPVVAFQRSARIEGLRLPQRAPISFDDANGGDPTRGGTVDAAAPFEGGSDAGCGALGQSCCASSTTMLSCTIGLACQMGKCLASTDDVGHPCTTGMDCRTHLCLVNGPKVCSVQCASTAECIPGWTCDPLMIGILGCLCRSSPEICNGKDDDCNGKIDDEPLTDTWCNNKQPGSKCVQGACTTTTDGG